MTQYATFARIKGEWRYEGFITDTDPRVALDKLYTMKEEVESDNGRGSFHWNLMPGSNEDEIPLLILRVMCPHCKRMIRVNSDGYLMNHRKERSRKAPGCNGSGMARSLIPSPDVRS